MVFYYPFWMLQFFQHKFLDCESITHIIWHVKKTRMTNVTFTIKFFLNY